MKIWNNITKDFFGITHPHIPKFLHWFWKKWFCSRNMHLFDEVLFYRNEDENKRIHYLYCDACDLVILFDKIDITYVDRKLVKKWTKNFI